MSGDKNTSPDPYTQAQAQNGTLDAVMQTGKVLNPFGGASMRGIHFGRTSFEGYDLNDMIDIVESAKPELLEAAGTALVAARDAIKAAAEELKGNLPGIDWQGEAHSAFDRWAQSLVKTAEGVGDYADVIGTQVLAAGAGLAQVRASMPPRDTRSERKTVDDIPESKRVESNEEYAAALKAEKNRQEAINQMYRLASFYTVSAGYMQQAEEPVFPKMPNVGVPEPQKEGSYDPLPGAGYNGDTNLGAASGEGTGAGARRAPETGAVEPGTREQLAERTSTDGPAPQPVGTEIDSVGALPPQEAVKPTTGTPPLGGGPQTAPGAPGTVPPMAPGVSPPVGRGPLGRPAGPGGIPPTKLPSSSQGRIGGLPGTGPVTRPGPVPGQAGMRPGPVPGPGPVTGRGPATPGPGGSAARPSQTVPRVMGPGAQGIVGGVPKSAGPVTGHAGSVPRSAVGATAAGRSNGGVVGGRPVTGATSGRTSSKLPRGTVIGGEGTSPPRTPGRKPDQRGVIGAAPATPPAGRTPSRSANSGGGVVGVPRGKGSGTRNSQRTGGAAASRSEARTSPAPGTLSQGGRRRGDESATD